MVGHFKLDGASSGNISNNTTTGFEDSSGSSNGTAKNTNGTGMAWSAGQIGLGAVTFDGVDDYVTAGDPASGVFDMGTGNFTVSAWVSGGTAGLRGIVGKSGSPGWFLRDLGGPSLQLYITNGTNIYSGSFSFPALHDGAWHHIVASVTRSNADVTFYVDGVARTVTSNNGNLASVTGDISNAVALTFGARSPGDDNRWNGSIDDVRIYSRALSSSDATELYNYRPDITNPSVSTLSPADNATGVAIGANAVITFDESVVVGTGNITIKKTSDNSTVETIAVTSGQVTGGGTNTIVINPSSNLSYSTGYYVQIDATAFDDASGNSYAGISDTTSWNFTTGEPDVTNPTVSALSPTDNSVNIATTSNLVITFDEGVNKETGNIVIHRTSDNAVIETIDVTSGQVTGDGTDTITINPSVTLAYSTEYYVLVASTAFDDTSGNSYAGITSTTAWSFTTENEFDTFYVSVADGDDTNCTGLASTAYVSGTNQSCPWKTIAKVNASTFGPGDSILFKRGETWTDELNPPSSGTSGSHIIFGAYGSGNLPIIDGENVRNGVDTLTKTNLTFQNLRVIRGNSSGIVARTGAHTFDSVEFDSNYTGGNATGDSVVTVINSTFTNNANEGFGMHVTADATITGSTFTDNIQGVNTSVTLGGGSTISVTGSYFSNTTDEFYIDGNMTTASITKSIFRPKATMSHLWAFNPGTTVQYNIVDLTDWPSSTGGLIDLNSAGTQNIYNTVFYGGAGGNSGSFNAYGNTFNFYNTIFYNTWRLGYITTGAINLYNSVVYDLTTRNITSSTGEVTVDPLFVDAANGDFTLQSTSPAINAGLDVGLTSDYSEHLVPQGAAPDIGAYEYDLIAPTVTAFTIPSTASSLTVTVDTFTATDAVAVTGYKITESSTAPAWDASGWSGTAPTEYTFTTEGSKTLYAWAKDAVGNVSTSANDTITVTLPTYTIGGTTSGLTGTVILQNNAGDSETVTTGSFTFDTSLANSASYAVTVLTQPSGQTCTVSNGSGTVASANVTNVSVSCSTNAVPSPASSGSSSGSSASNRIKNLTASGNIEAANALAQQYPNAVVQNVTTPTNTKPTTYNFGPTTLKLKSRGEAVKELQRFLNAELNLGLVIDGILGPKTTVAVKKFQSENGLVVDGLVGPKTKEKMNASL